MYLSDKEVKYKLQTMESHNVTAQTRQGCSCYLWQTDYVTAVDKAVTLVRTHAFKLTIFKVSVFTFPSLSALNTHLVANLVNLQVLAKTTY